MVEETSKPKSWDEVREAHARLFAQWEWEDRGSSCYEPAPLPPPLPPEGQDWDEKPSIYEPARR